MQFIAEKGERLDKFLAEQLEEYSRAQLQKLIKEGRIEVNGKTAIKPSAKLKEGDRVSVSNEALAFLFKEIVLGPEDIPLDIVYEDKDILVINKPAGLLVHPTASQKEHTLANALIAKYPDIRKVGENPLRPGIAHRLDKDTSGLLIVAKNQKAFQFIKEQFLKRRVVKKYLALVEGMPKEKSGVIGYPIRPSKKYRLKKVAVRKPAVGAGAKKSVRAAETYYQVKQSYEIGSRKIALLEVIPKTGRTHQIRVHLAAIGHPVVGDTLYGSGKGKAKSEKGLEPRRQMLHAYSLAFTAPSGKRLELEIGLPNDMKEVIKSPA